MPIADHPVPSRAPPRFPPDAARAAVAAFDLKSLPAAFYDNPYPYFHALRGNDAGGQMNVEQGV